MTLPRCTAMHQIFIHQEANFELEDNPIMEQKAFVFYFILFFLFLGYFI